MLYPCNMSLAYFGDSWQDHRDRPGYLAQGWEPGLDILSMGQAKIDLVSVLGGKVTRDKDAGYNMGFGVYCEIDHGLQPDGHRYKSLYAHMAGNLTSVGQAIKPGQVIGVMGSTGNSSVVHVHFILWKDGKNVDPMQYLTGAVVLPPVVPPPDAPPTGKIVTPIAAVNVRTAPAVLAANAIGLLHPGKTIESTGEIVESQGRKWLKCIVYIASEFLGGV